MIRRTLEGVWTLEDAEGEGPLSACYKDFVSKYNSPQAGSAAENCILVSTVTFDDGTISESVETIVPSIIFPWRGRDPIRSL